jgi:hypothetical protein
MKNTHAIYVFAECAQLVISSYTGNTARSSQKGYPKGLDDIQGTHTPGMPNHALTCGTPLGRKYTVHSPTNATRSPVNFSNQVWK